MMVEVRVARWVCCLFLAAVFFFPTLTSAEFISDLQYNLLGGDAFYTPGMEYDKEFFLYEDFSWDSGRTTGAFRVLGESQYNYEIRGGSVELTPSKLLDDQSHAGIPFVNDNIAQGYFASGATLRITGSIWHTVYDEQNNPVAEEEIFTDGLLLESTVNFNFYVKEEDFQANVIHSQVDLYNFGGELVTGTLQLESHAIADITLMFSSQYDNPGMQVEDFAGDISYLPPSILQMYSAPEPVTVMLLGFGSLLAMRTRKK